MEDRKSLEQQTDCLSVEITTRCNSSCSHCFVRARKERRKNLPLGQAKSFIQEAYKAGYRLLHVTGGEPLLSKDLIPLLDHAFGIGYETAFVNTNGTLLTCEMAGTLARFRKLSLSVSLQGLRQLHDRMRGKGSHDLALRGIDNALTAGLPVHIFTTVGRSLLPDLARFAGQLFSDFPDIRRLTLIQLIRVQNDAFDLSEELLSPDDFLGLVRIASLLNLYGLNVDMLNNPLAVAASKVLGMPLLSSSPSLYQPGNLMIAADQRLTIAHSTPERLGVYEPGMLATTINSHAYCNAISSGRWMCQECSYVRLCSTEGLIKPSEQDKDMFSDVPYCRRVLAKASSYG